ncbi:MAG: helicase-related protein [Armatimonadota bacterium]
MPDIIDNRTTKLAERISHYLRLSRRAHFAVGYFYLGGFEAIAGALPGLEKLRLLIGPATNRATAEQMARGYRARPLIEQQWRREVFPRDLDRARMREETAHDARETVALLDQTDENQQTVAELARLVAEGVIEVRVYTKEPLHAKCYIFDEVDAERAQTDPGQVIVGSSNLTVAGITSNTELNVVLHDPDSHREVSAWFERLWEDADEFAPELLREMRASWAVNEGVTPWEIYIKTLYNLFRDQLEAEAEPAEFLDEDFPVLAEFQEHAFNWARAILQQHGGVLIADVVGLGKSYVGLALLKWGRRQGMRPMVICPAALTGMWQAYSDLYDVGAAVVSMGGLTVREDEEGERWSVLDDERYEARDLILIDESHNLRYTNTQRYEAVEAFLSRGDRKVIMLTATPMAIGPDDIRNQLRLWPGGGQRLPTGQYTFDDFFNRVKKGEAELPELLRHVMIRRGRRYVATEHGVWRQPDGSPCTETDPEKRWEVCRPVIMVGDREYTFPRRELKEPVTYRIDETYQRLYGTIRAAIDREYEDEDGLPAAQVLAQVAAGRQGRQAAPLTADEGTALLEALGEGLSYARYGLFDYVRPERRAEEPYKSLATAGANLRGLMRTLLFKRLESSVEAFRVTCRTLAQMHRRFVVAMDEGRIPAGEEMQAALYDLGLEDVAASDVLEAVEQAERKAPHRYDIKAFEAERLRADLQHDAVVFEALYDMVCDIGPEDDAKLLRLRALLDEIPHDEKLILFTQFEDTARYLYDQLRHDPQVDWISGARDVASIVGRFAPRSNPALARRFHGGTPIRVLISTDVLSEGMNLQDAHYVVNYDLHFNPVRLIQRMGRIDRLSPFFPEDETRSPEIVWAYNFFPETHLDAHLNLEAKVRARIAEMGRVVGLDSPVLHPSEEIDEEGVLRLYTGDARAVQEDDSEVASAWAEAEQAIRALQRERPEELARIAHLPDGVRSARVAQGDSRRFFVYCQAGDLHQLYLADADGEIESTDASTALSAIACEEDEPRAELPPGINRVVSKVKAHFDETVRQMAARRRTRPAHSAGQKYALSHLNEQLLFAADEEKRIQIARLIEAFSEPLPVAVRKRLRRLQKQKLEGDALRQQLARIYFDFQLFELRSAPSANDHIMPRVICSEGL